MRFATYLLAGSLLLATPGCGSDETTSPQEPPIPPCEPSARPDASFAAERDPASSRIALARAIADRTMQVHDPTSMAWDWGPGVLMLSLVDLHRVTGDDALRDFYQAWLDHHMASGYRPLLTSSDRCPPALTALALYQQSCELPYRTVVTDTLDYLYHDALRTEDGGINHLGTTDLFGVSLWLDSLFMFGSVLERWGEHEGDARALDEIESQFIIFASHLQDPSGWMMHAWGWPNEQTPGSYWARGNSWVTASGYELLRIRAERGESAPEVEGILSRQVDAIVAAQDPTSGLWWTVPNRPGETYLETSASALFALGLARGYRAGWLDGSVLPVIDAAMTGVEAQVVDDGSGPVVTGISGPTTVGDFDHYASIAVESDVDFGVGAVILALIETSGL